MIVRDYRARTGVPDNVQQLAAPVDNIGRHRPYPPDFKVADQVFRGTVEINADPVAFLNAKREETEADPVLVPSNVITVLRPRAQKRQEKFFLPLSRMIITSMADEAREPTRDAPQQQSQPAQQPRQSNPRRQRDGQPRHHQFRPRPPQNSQQPRGQQRPAIPAREPADEKEVGLDDEDTEQERASQPQRGRGHRGKPEKKKYEEFINDPYCE